MTVDGGGLHVMYLSHKQVSSQLNVNNVEIDEHWVEFFGSYDVPNLKCVTELTYILLSAMPMINV